MEFPRENPSCSIVRLVSDCISVALHVYCIFYNIFGTILSMWFQAICYCICVRWSCSKRVVVSSSSIAISSKNLTLILKVPCNQKPSK